MARHRWEYQVVWIKDQAMDGAALLRAWNLLGADGWEVMRWEEERQMPAGLTPPPPGFHHVPDPGWRCWLKRETGD